MILVIEIPSVLPDCKISIDNGQLNQELIESFGDRNWMDCLNFLAQKFAGNKCCMTMGQYKCLETALVKVCGLPNQLQKLWWHNL